VENFKIVQRPTLLHTGHWPIAGEILDILPIHRQAVYLQGGFVRAPFGAGGMSAVSLSSRAPNIPPKTKDPSGGTTGRVKLYGRLGWMGARAEYSLDGEG
jgi:hypothetical protein